MQPCAQTTYVAKYLTHQKLCRDSKALKNERHMSYFTYVANSDIFRSYNDYQGTVNVFTIKESIPKVLKRNSCKEDSYIPYYEINFLVIKPPRCTNFTNLFWHETLYFSDSSSVRNTQSFMPNKSVKLVHLVGFIIKKFVTMHGHMNVKNYVITYNIYT